MPNEARIAQELMDVREFYATIEGVELRVAVECGALTVSALRDDGKQDKWLLSYIPSRGVLRYAAAQSPGVCTDDEGRVLDRVEEIIYGPGPGKAA